MIPRGLIVAWFGAIVDIPAGWLFCDGNNDTPDLRNLFIVGAGAPLNPGDNNPNPQHVHALAINSHNHSFTSDAHNHNLTGTPAITAGAHIGAQITNEVVTGDTDGKVTSGTAILQGAVPPYHALAYIMKS